MPHFRSFSKLVLLSTLLAFVSVSCASNKVQQCRKIIEITVGVSDQIEELSDNGKTQDPQEAREAANAMEKAAQEIEGLVIQDEQLQEYQAGFVKTYRGFSQSTYDFIAELEKKNLQAAKSVQKKLQEVGSTEEELVNGINNYCQSE
ncbi:MAG: hypothetical protein WA865_21875 [Spirulinaceae cyanobacterium]